MSSTLFGVIRLLEAKGVRFNMERASPYAVIILATMVGKRIEITVDESDIVDVSVFRGSEDVEVGMAAVEKAIEDEDA